MGTCMSRCASSSQEKLENVQDKLVISQTPLPTFHPSSPKQSQSTLPPPSKQVTSSSPSSKQTASPSPPSKRATPSSLSTTSTTTTSCITTTSFSHSSTLSSASSSGLTNDNGGEISRPRLKKNARSSPTNRKIIERPRPSSAPTKNPRRFQKLSTKEDPPKLNVGIPRRCSRSTSPSLSRQRSNRNETKEPYSSSVSLSRQNLASRSPCSSFQKEYSFHVQGDPRKENPKKKKKKKKNGVGSRSRSPFSSQRFFDGRPDPCGNPCKRRSRERRGGRSPSPSGGGRFNTDAHRRWHPAANEKNRKKGAKVATMMENMRPRPVLSTASKSGFCLEEGPRGDYDHTHGDAISRKLHDMGLRVEQEEEEEDVDNPLISLDCFIFL